MSVLRRAGAALIRASQYLGSVFVAVLLAPVLPDAAVELFGAPSPTWRNPVLRGAAVLLVIAVCVGVDQIRRWRARRREARAPMPELGHYAVLVQPLSPKRYGYRPRASERPGDKTVPEVNVDAAAPRLVVAVATPQIHAVSLDELKVSLAADDVDFDVVSVSEPDDVKEVVPEVTQRVLAKLREHDVDPADVCFDTTGGNVPVSLAMLRAAALYGSDCCYVSSRQDRDGRAPRTQLPRSFDPAALFGATQ
ncbi:MAG: hypothetical protein M3R63_07895 [Actinomycetota bacterium]|nr:hypothetical protein [Actinomycetota bacterium]